MCRINYGNEKPINQSKQHFETVNEKQKNGRLMDNNDENLAYKIN